MPIYGVNILPYPKYGEIDRAGILQLNEWLIHLPRPRTPLEYTKRRWIQSILYDKTEELKCGL